MDVIMFANFRGMPFLCMRVGERGMESSFQIVVQSSFVTQSVYIRSVQQDVGQCRVHVG